MTAHADACCWHLQQTAQQLLSREQQPRMQREQKWSRQSPQPLSQYRMLPVLLPWASWELRWDWQ